MVVGVDISSDDSVVATIAVSKLLRSKGRIGHRGALCYMFAVGITAALVVAVVSQGTAIALAVIHVNVFATRTRYLLTPHAPLAPHVSQPTRRRAARARSGGGERDPLGAWQRVLHWQGLRLEVSHCPRVRS